MKRCFFYIIGLGLCWSGAVNAAEEPPAPSPVSAYLSKWEVMGKEQAKETYEHRTFSVDVLLNCQKPSRFCPAKSMETTFQMVDSRGGKSAMLKSDMMSFRMVNQGQAMTMSINSGKWMPTPESSYVDLKGMLSVLISNGMLSVTEPVKLELKEGTSAPVVLKNAGDNGKDVNATLSVKEYVVDHLVEGRKVWRITLCLTAQEPTAVHTLSTATLEQKALSSGFLSMSQSPLTWTATFQLPDVPEKVILVKIRHDQGVKQVKLPIDFRCSWAVPNEPANFGRKEDK